MHVQLNGIQWESLICSCTNKVPPALAHRCQNRPGARRRNGECRIVLCKSFFMKLYLFITSYWFGSKNKHVFAHLDLPVSYPFYFAQGEDKNSFDYGFDSLMMRWWKYFWNNWFYGVLMVRLQLLCRLSTVASGGSTMGAWEGWSTGSPSTSAMICITNIVNFVPKVASCVYFWAFGTRNTLSITKILSLMCFPF